MTEYLATFGATPLRTNARDVFLTGTVTNLAFVRDKPLRAFGRFISLRPEHHMRRIFEPDRVRGGPDPMRAAAASKAVYDLRPWMPPPQASSQAPSQASPQARSSVHLRDQANVAGRGSSAAAKQSARDIQRALGYADLEIQDGIPPEAVAAAILLLGG